MPRGGVIGVLRFLGVAAVLWMTIGLLDAATAASADAATMDVYCLQGGPSLQAAINVAGRGDTIRIHGVCAGTFYVPGTGGVTSLTLQGVGGATLKGNSTGPVLTIEDGASVTVKDLNVTGGRNKSGAGGIEVDAASLDLSGSTVFGNSGCQGGGIAVLGSSARITNSSVRDNLATCRGNGVGGGIEVCGLSVCGFAGQTTLTMIDSTISGNTAESNGGAVELVLAQAMIVSSTIRGNTANGLGGGIYNQVGSSLNLSKSVISSNVATVAGGGISNDIAQASISDSVFDGNSSLGFDANSGVGGAIFNISEGDFTLGGVTFNGASSVSINATTFTGNRAAFGGAISNVATGGRSATLVGTGLVIRGNVANSPTWPGWGGGAFNQDEGGNAVLTFAQSRLSENHAAFGGGVFNRAPGGVAATILRSGTIVTSNSAGVDGGGVYNVESGSIQLKGAELFNNTPNDCVGC